MPASSLQQILDAIHAAAAVHARTDVRLLAVSKTKPAEAVAALAAQGQRAFGENYVQEADAKIAQLRALGLEWHLIGHLQSNKAELASQCFDWVQTVDRAKLIPLLARHRPDDCAPLKVLIQVNIDDEDSKHGCAPEAIDSLAEAIALQPRLQLRGLMAIPAPFPDQGRRGAAFTRMQVLFEQLKTRYRQVDTLSMGMSSDFAEAIAAGATMVRVGTALFGARGQAPAASA
ncbi:YggS family pyridoxal phosphate-dependent enzyme [Xanthomonas oryzae pv. oryzicola]|uniref:YggS family pyridoxal phosphate-dependent enzyme n=1 Tax=Xanthomonas oryzae TaxID=347 RepID=UPI0005CE1CCA|nr:YggS family pyridoxal phosphate-dependent enzyme [Xanthomonas oryzae]AJQ88372.1 pyridoxal phosphate biosynthesis protein [Xanthomonas oryzae pv. oryzicola]AKO05281.1 pyridoxal phosphate biosynthesis protein [Xanthomonas oryzae pv. oryzicola]AKO09167.1 pyridoxal phosphate biosynthesis protein [Xanthomonas oryzae pv. oryzicola]OWB25482.1 YggS family pyridoxal phosphate enzyme [Xanthomonas oryzae pv. oryzicola]OWB26638.1 YggS family pyridoxal phosphate enzyme [Xanthomonas oryzae pv. oryzicola]